MSAIVGPSGCRKSTLLNLSGTLGRPTDDIVKIDGVDVSTLNDADLSALRAHSIGFIFQQFHLAEGQPALERVTIARAAVSDSPLFPPARLGHLACGVNGYSRRPTRTLLSALGNTIGIAAMISAVNILKPTESAPELNSTALIGKQIAASQFNAPGKPTTPRGRSTDAAITTVRSLLGPLLNPNSPDAVLVLPPSVALVEKNAGVASIALLIGSIGMANTMINSALERRHEVGLRRTLGTKRSHVLVQFIAEVLLLGLLRGAPGCIIGVGALAGRPISLGLTLGSVSVII